MKNNPFEGHISLSGRWKDLYFITIQWISCSWQSDFTSSIDIWNL